MVGIKLSKEKLRRAVQKAGAALKRFAQSCTNDVLILGGAAVGIYATFRIDTTAGIYALGAAMAAVGWYLTLNPIEKR